MQELDYVVRIIEDNSKKLDKLTDKVQNLGVISAKQEINLREHMRRSDTLEKSFDIMKKEVKPVVIRVKAIEILLMIGVTLLGLIPLLSDFIKFNF